MDKKITIDQKRKLAKEFKLELAVVLAIFEIEASGYGFDPKTGKIIIQFEPNWFRKYAKTWIPNGVENQLNEWKAFNAAYKISPDSALLSTSIGLGQIMGFNFRAAGFKTVGEMWDRFKESEYEQAKGTLNFIKSNPKLYAAAALKNWHVFATFYNGAGYKALAKKLGRTPYDESLAAAYWRYKLKYPND